MENTSNLITFNKLKLGLAQAEHQIKFYIHALKEYENMKRQMEGHAETIRFELSKLDVEELAEPVNLNTKDNGRNEKPQEKRPKGKTVSLSEAR